MPGRYLGPVRWTTEGDPAACASMEPFSRSALGWLFNQIGDQAGVRQGIWELDLGTGQRGAIQAIAVRDANGFTRSFVRLQTGPSSAGLEGLAGPDGGGEPTIVLLRIEPGLICIPSNTATAEYPWFVDTTDSVYSVATSPLPIIDSDPAVSQSPLGALTYTGDGVPGWAWNEEWPTWRGQLFKDAATLEGMRHINDDNRINLYSGEARLWAESCLAAGKTLSSKLPSSCSPSYTSLGIVWMPPNTGESFPRPWACSIGASGLTLWPMTVSERTKGILAWVWDNVWDSEPNGYRMLMVYVLADLKYETANAPVTLLDEDLSDFHAYGAPLAHGWHWRWAPLWESGSQSKQETYITLTKATLLRWASQSGKVAISSNEVDGVYIPTAILTVDIESAEWGGSNSLIHIPQPDNTIATLYPTGASIYGVEATVYSWTTALGGVCRLVAMPQTDAYNESDNTTASWPTWCGAGSRSNWRGTVSHHWRGGWKIIGDGAATEGFFDKTASEDRTFRSATITSSGVWQQTSDYPGNPGKYVYFDNWSGGATQTECNPGEEGLVSLGYPNGKTLTVEGGDWTSEIKRKIVAGGNGKAVAAILPIDTGAIVGSSWSSTTNRQYIGTNDSSGCQKSIIRINGLDRLSHYTDITIKAYQSGNPCTNTLGISAYYYLYGPSGLVGGNVYCPYNRVGYGSSILPSTYTDLPLSEKSMKMVTSSGNVVALDPDQWSDLFTIGDSKGAPVVMVSYTGLEAVQDPSTHVWSAEGLMDGNPSATPLAWAAG